MKKIIIFGAGASHGSDTFNTPPLTANLYRELCKFNKDGWGVLPNKISTIFENDFEKGMMLLSKKYPVWRDKLHRAMATYFFNFGLYSNKNLYIKLAKRLKNHIHGFALVTFNYERLLIGALNFKGIDIRIGLPVEKNRLELCFPHGACFLFCNVVKELTSKSIFINCRTSGPISTILDSKKFQERINSTALPPVMSYIDPQKETTSGINFIEQERNHYIDLIEKADEVLIIGLKFRPNEPHIWNPIKETKADLIYCSGKDTKEFESWIDKYRTNNQDLILNGYWKENFEEMCKKLEI